MRRGHHTGGDAAPMTMPTRRSVLRWAGWAGAAALTVGGLACNRHKDATERCANCGMKIDPASAFRARIDRVMSTDTKTATTRTPFDSPRCALTRYLTSADAQDTLRVQEFYSREWRAGADVVYVLDSDVIGPMGNDAIPVDRVRAAQFVHDHAGSGSTTPRVRELIALTPSELQSL